MYTQLFRYVRVDLFIEPLYIQILILYRNKNVKIILSILSLLKFTSDLPANIYSILEYSIRILRNNLNTLKLLYSL